MQRDDIGPGQKERFHVDRIVNDIDASAPRDGRLEDLFPKDAHGSASSWQMRGARVLSYGTGRRKEHPFVAGAEGRQPALELSNVLRHSRRTIRLTGRHEMRVKCDAHGRP